LFDTVRRANTAIDAGDAAMAAALASAVREICLAVGLRLDAPAEVPTEVMDRAAELDAARAAKDFATADAIRAELQADGWTVETTRDGTTVRR
jgi:cysteinyl-tRNA synthetase